MSTFPLSVPARRALAAMLLAVVLVVVAWRHAASGAGTPPLQVAPVRPAAPERAAAGLRASLVVDVAGAVRQPGLVHLSQGARVSDAVARAGGLTARAERDAVNLAARVADGQQVLVPTRGAAGGGGGSAGGAAAGPISLSAGTAEQLDTLPGIGPVTAQKIVAYREQHGPFTSVAGLDAIPGIGPARLDELKGLVVP